MLAYRAEGLCRNANHLTEEDLNRCAQNGEVLQSTALAFAWAVLVQENAYRDFS